MPWVKLDDHFDEHPKVARIGPLGIALQVAGLCYCNRNLTDGFIPRAVARTLLDWQTEQDGVLWTLARTSGMQGDDVTAQWVIDLLVDAGVWEEADGGYRVHDYADYQPTKEAIDIERRKKQAAGQAGGLARAKQVLEQTQSTSSSKIQAKLKPVPVPVPVPVPLVNKHFSEEETESVPAPKRGTRAAFLSPPLSSEERGQLIARFLAEPDFRNQADIEEVIEYAIERNNDANGKYWKSSTYKGVLNWLKTEVRFRGSRNGAANGRNPDPQGKPGEPRETWTSAAALNRRNREIWDAQQREQREQRELEAGTPRPAP